MSILSFWFCIWCCTWFRCCAFWSCCNHICIQRRTYTCNLCRFTIFRCDIQRRRWLRISSIVRSRLRCFCFHCYRAYWFHHYVRRNLHWCCIFFRSTIHHISWFVVLVAHFRIRITFAICVCIRATYVERTSFHICESHIILRSVCNLTICILFYSQVFACYHFHSIAWFN